MSRVPVVLALACLSAVAPLPAQTGALPKRTRLTAGADTNDPRAYYEHGVTLLARDPRAAVTAFEWSSRLDPGWAEALYARRVAGLLADEDLLVDYMEGVRQVVTSRTVQHLDTLEYRARLINPFFLRDLDRQLITGYILASVNREVRRRTGRPLDPNDQAGLDHAVDNYLRTGSRMRLRGVIAASNRQFPQAVDLLRGALTEDGNGAGIQMDRARVFFAVGSYDSALVAVQSALAVLRDRDGDRLQRVYESLELFEHGIGMIHESREDAAAARDAYGRALQENLGYYPAHVRLALLGLAAGDTGTATQELDLAVQVAPDEPMVRLRFAALLAQRGRLEEAMTHLRHAAVREPFYALPHYLLGRLAEAGGQREAAIEGYRAYLALTSQRDPRRADATQRLTALTAN